MMGRQRARLRNIRYIAGEKSPSTAIRKYIDYIPCKFRADSWTRRPGITLNRDPSQLSLDYDPKRRI